MKAAPSIKKRSRLSLYGKHSKAMIKKVVILGPESTGKSTLCALLADHYNTVWVKEYAREYLLTNGTAYTFDNLLDVAKGQLALEEMAIKSFSRQQPGGDHDI